MKSTAWITAFLLILSAAGSRAADVTLTSPDKAAAHGACGTSTRLYFDDRVVVIHEPGCGPAGGRLLSHDVDRNSLYLLRDHRPMKDRSGYEPLFSSDGFQLASVIDPASLASRPDVWIAPVQGDMVVTGRDEEDVKYEADPLVQEFLDGLDPTSFGSYLSSLSVSVATRFSCTQGVIQARDAITTAFLNDFYETSTPAFNNWCYMCSQVTGFNVVGIKIGTVRPDDYYLVGAHYDSISQNACNIAPGSNDNASGTAAVMELARAFADVDTEGSIIFVAFGGEELGLLGSYRYAQDLAGQGMLGKIKGFVILDMISYYADTWGVLMEGSNSNQQQIDILNQVAGLAGTYTDIQVSTTYDYWGSDHEPFLDRGVAGVMMIESDWDQYSPYHTTNDIFSLQNLDFGIEVTKVAGAALATWAVIIPEPEPDDDDDDDDDSADDDDDDDSMDDDDAGDDSSDDDASGDDDDDSECCG